MASPPAIYTTTQTFSGSIKNSFTCEVFSAGLLSESRRRARIPRRLKQPLPSTVGGLPSTSLTKTGPAHIEIHFTPRTLNWSNGQAPTNSNTYSTGAYILRTPTGSSSYTFQGASLTISTNGNLYYKGGGSTGTITVNNLIFAGGTNVHNSGTLDYFRLAGNVNIAADSSIYAEQGPTIISAVISGSAKITDPGSDCATCTLIITNSAAGSPHQVLLAGTGLALAPLINLSVAGPAQGLEPDQGRRTLPVVAADVPGAREQLGDAALLVAPTDPVEITGAVRKLEDQALRKKLIERGSRRAEDRTPAGYIDGVLRFLDEFERTRRCWGANGSVRTE